MPTKEPQIKTCPRCHQSFECKTNDIVNCQCQGIIVGGETWEFISNLYSDCLCKNCLLQLGKKIGALE